MTDNGTLEPHGTLEPERNSERLRLATDWLLGSERSERQPCYNRPTVLTSDSEGTPHLERAEITIYSTN